MIRVRASNRFSRPSSASVCVVRHLDVADRRALLGRQPLPRDQVRVVLHLREEDLVALAHVRASPRVRDEVDRLGRVAREDDALRRWSVDELRDLRSRFLVRRRRLFAEAVDGAMDVRVVVLVVVDELVDHLPRLLRSRRVVEVNERLPVHLPLEDREVLADPCDVERHAAASRPTRNRGSASLVRSSRNTRSGSIST